MTTKSVASEAPLVSVIIPFYNRTHWLLEAIQSVLSQTYSNWEVILINDGSTENIQHILKLIQKDSRFHLVEQANTGVAAARNAGIAIAKGSYVAFLDSDDLWVPEKLEKQIRFMQENGYEVSHTSYCRFDSHGNKETVDTSSIQGILLPSLIEECIIGTPTVIVSHALLSQISGPFCDRYQYGEDACLYISLAALAPFGAISEPLTLVRVHGTTAANNIGKIRTALTCILDYLLHNDNLSVYKEQIDILYSKISQCTCLLEKQTENIGSIRKKLAELGPMRQVVKSKFKAKGFYPKVSIVIPVYNGANYIRDAINSALLQTYPNIEVLVINDGSTDGGKTAQIASLYGELIRYYHKDNGGVATALNLGIEKMTGDYFSWLSHDDMYTPEKIEKELEILSKQTDLTMLIAEGYQVVDAQGNYLYTVNIRDQYSEERLRSALFCLLRGGINGCAMLIHKSHFERVGNFDPKLPTTQDYDLWFRMFRGRDICYMPTANVLSRSHEEQGSKAMLSEHVKECDTLWIGMMQSLTMPERIDISKSNYLFYKEMWEFLRSVTGYTGAIEFAERKMLCEALNEYEQSRDEKLLDVVTQGCRVERKIIKEVILPYRKKKHHKERVFFQLGERNTGGGLNRIVVQTATELSKRYDVVIGSWREPYRDGYQSGDSVIEICLDYPVHAIPQYVHLLSLLQVDVYVLSYCCSPIWLPLVSAMKKSEIKTIAWSHEDYFLPYLKDSLWSCLPVRYQCLPEADAVVWLNTKSHTVYSAQHDNGTCIPNLVPIDSPVYSVHDRGRRLIAVGRFNDPIKGLDDLLQVYSRVLKQHKDTELYVVGTYDLQLPIRGKEPMTCMQFINRAGIPDDKLHFIGWKEDISRYYQLGALHIMPSLYEGFGLVVLEAAANGMPTVAYGGSGMADIITDGKDGVIVERGNWECMADRITLLLDNPEKITHMQENLPALLCRYRPDVISDAWSELFDTLMQGDSAIEKYFADRKPRQLDVSTASLAINEYESLILRLYTRLVNVPSMPAPEPVIYENEASTPNINSIWKTECQLIQASFSWRVTKPLRFVKKIFTFLKRGGPLLLFRKMRAKRSVKPG